jgi:hypothetical protein
VSADGLDRDPARPLHTPTLDELFKASEPITSVDALARDEFFDDGEVEEFLAELYARRRSDVA